MCLVFRAERKAFFCVGGWGRMTALATEDQRGSTRLTRGRRCQADVMCGQSMATWMYLEHAGSSLYLEVCVKDGRRRGARVQVPGRSDWPQQRRKLPSSRQASLSPDPSSLELPLLIALAGAYLSPGGSLLA